MRVVKTVVSLLVCGLVLEGCGYVVLPPEASAEASTAFTGLGGHRDWYRAVGAVERAHRRHDPQRQR